MNKNETTTVEVVKIDPKEYGLEAKKVKSIEEAFQPKIIERDGLIPFYKEILEKEITKEVCDEAHKLGNKLTKVRTGISGIHKTQKAFFLAAGRFVDAWKNKETEPILQMEENLTTIQNHFKIQEENKRRLLQEKRVKQISKYLPDAIHRDLSSMEEDVWKAFFATKKEEYKTRIAEEKKAEEERLEIIRIQNLRWERATEINPYLDFFDKDSGIDLGTLSDKDFDTLFSNLKSKKDKYDKAQEKIRLENEQLKKKEEDRIKKAIEEQKRKETLLKDRFDYLKNEYGFIESGYDLSLPDTWSIYAEQAMNMTDKEWSSYLLDIEKAIKNKKDVDDEIARVKLEIEILEKENEVKLQLAIKAEKEAAELFENEEKKRKLQEKNAALAPDKVKLEKLLKDISSIEIPKLKTKEADKISSDISGLIKKTTDYLKQKIKTL